MFIKLNEKNEVVAFSEVQPQILVYNSNSDFSTVADGNFIEIDFVGNPLHMIFENGQLLHSIKTLKVAKIQELESDFNAAKKITIQNGNTLVIAHDTPERPEFIQLIENISNLDTTNNAVFIYKQQTDSGKLALRILPEIAAYIFKDLFITTLSTGTKVNLRVHNKTVTYELALEKINNAQSITDLDSITWNFLNPQGILIDVNTEAAKLLSDASVSDFAKATINAAKDPITGEIHLVKTLQELADDS